MTCKQCKHITVCMAQADVFGQVFDPNYDGEHGCTDFVPCTNADRFRAMSDEEQQKCVRRFREIENFADWLKQTADGE